MNTLAFQLILALLIIVILLLVVPVWVGYLERKQEEEIRQERKNRWNAPTISRDDD